MNPSFYITTLGCPKNTADSGVMHHSLLEEGVVPAGSPEEATFHLINTCTFIREATEETIQTILDAGQVKKSKEQKLVVVGCFAERYPDEIQNEMGEVDYLFGTGKYHLAGKLIKETFPLQFEKLVTVKEELLKREQYSEKIENYSKPYSFIKISDGCNRGCSFCIIPKLRGEFRDSPLELILRDTTNAVRSGSKEICLVSQDSVFYGKDLDTLKHMISKVSAVPGVELLRLLYLYPDKKTLKLLDLFPELPNLAPYLESPVQHVSEKVLKSMNRSGSFSFFEELFAKARSIVPGLEIRTSFILGYPGETPEDVDAILQFLEKVKPEKANFFAYSPEEGTAGGAVQQTVKEKEKSRRVNLAREVHLENLKKIHQDRVGKVFSAIVDEVDDQIATVRRFQDAPEIDEVVFVENLDLKVGEIGKVRVDSFMEYDMTGAWV